MKKIFTLIVVALFATTTFAQKTFRIRIHKNDNSITGFMLSDVDSLTFAKKEVPPTQSMEIKLANTTPANTLYTITPSNDDFDYYQFIVSEESYNIIKEKYGSLFEHDKEWWKALAEYNTGITWKDVMKTLVSKGEKTFNSSNTILSLRPNSKYCIYAYGIDTENVAVTSDITEYWFTTPNVEISDNVLEITNVTPEKKAFIVNVSTSNDDPYVVTYQTAESFNNLVNEQGSEEAALDQMIYITTNYGGYGDMVHNGRQEVRLENLDSGTEYVIFVFGYKYGARNTEYKKINATTLSN
ncbi:hypothetical protein [Prevotella sp. OH937_COT-195]|uniref:hypothetical protein n=1 Tax=Prevotella sp. OH937_COT-195 TaxID=2491051 RepID=UPI000F648670|nr:hypothetical protein [Prevotella sp. OH937_COT-195]RRC98417.1 hypothetical protein EII32_09245 [Prevotella sp. OH937_COT-195]